MVLKLLPVPEDHAESPPRGSAPARFRAWLRRQSLIKVMFMAWVVSYGVPATIWMIGRSSAVLLGRHIQ